MAPPARLSPERYLDHLAREAVRLREIGGRDLDAPVPTCPEWRAGDLLRHVALVYQHKVETIRGGAWPEQWPPEQGSEGPVAHLERSLADLTAELSARAPDETAVTWYDPDQTIGFWARRMALETVVHRVDAELAQRVPIAPIPDDLAIDGIDEVLVTMLAFYTGKWPEDFGDRLTRDPRAVAIEAGPGRWTVRPAKTGVEVIADGPAAASVAGRPQDVLLWSWRRASGDALTFGGDRAPADLLRELLGEVTT
ncbi:maleylpyruvate isomerase family mycothiol-dependent enzyme [Nonomuraea sp. NN258]|uniref:maleylpyruvate isomerase family mycothiol-dependent enzyme n=1 Tax=Nonomuraea antri TaxID=2730852 RepID=UPI0015695FFA|nr:maleylpyruvate isomerase family mycothiol-dependent enzyme [Nonomuraea antri]NRQ35663.1 maleylpyruvate isomerase family mycothiol-dependent enzyme [Nonomuraea antri]